MDEIDNIGQIPTFTVPAGGQEGLEDCPVVTLKVAAEIWFEYLRNNKLLKM